MPSRKWVDTAGMSLRLLFSDPGKEYVWGESQKVWHSEFGKRKYPGTHVLLTLQISVSSYLKLLNKIPDGVIYDPKNDTWCLAAAIEKVINRNTVIVRAGRQGRGFGVDNRQALVYKDDEGDWVVKKWLKP